MVLRCRLGVWSRIVIQQTNARSEKSMSLFTNRLFRFRHGVTVPLLALMVPASKKSRNKTSWASQKTMRSTLPAEGVVLNFFRTGDDGFFHSIDVTFALGVKWCSHSSLITMRNRKPSLSTW
ncbi:hypothetical protein TNCV_1685901 [Trichonephila clavipes]|nr:hypothetical protein TNCV_1685901 [Trichonephila clavipes]